MILDDVNRVKLNNKNGCRSTDYINASYVQVSCIKRKECSFTSTIPDFRQRERIYCDSKSFREHYCRFLGHDLARKCESYHYDYKSQ
jgi:hypothetical protein